MAGNRLRPLLAAEEKIIAKNMTSSTFHTPTLLEQNYDQLADQVKEHGGTYGGASGFNSPLNESIPVIEA